MIIRSILFIAFCALTSTLLAVTPTPSPIATPSPSPAIPTPQLSQTPRPVYVPALITDSGPIVTPSPGVQGSPGASIQGSPGPQGIPGIGSPGPQGSPGTSTVGPQGSPGASSFATGGNIGTAATTATTGTMTVNMTTAQITITPTGACTFNASGGTAQQITTFVITTSGTTSFVLTWGTNFKSVGTLATGTTTGKKFSVTFRCIDGTSWQEIARTTAM